MAFVNHVNLAAPESGTVYCRLRNKVVVLDENHLDNYCATCPMFRGSAQGEGVECYWNDKRKGVTSPHVVVEPVKELNQVLIADVITPDSSIIVDK